MSFNSIAFEDNGIHTDVVLADFEDNNLVIITEFSKIGEVYLVKKDTFYSLEGQEDLYSVQGLLGSEDERSLGAVRFLAERLKIPKNTVFSVTLKDFSVSHLRQIAEVLEKHKKW